MHAGSQCVDISPGWVFPYSRVIRDAQIHAVSECKQVQTVVSRRRVYDNGTSQMSKKLYAAFH